MTAGCKCSLRSSFLALRHREVSVRKIPKCCSGYNENLDAQPPTRTTLMSGQENASNSSSNSTEVEKLPLNSRRIVQIAGSECHS